MSYDDKPENLREKLQAEMDILPWSELVRHFAFGRLYVVRRPWDLLEAALKLNADSADSIKKAMEEGSFGVPSPEEAKAWHEAAQDFDVLVISPFVLVSPRAGDA